MVESVFRRTVKTRRLGDYELLEELGRGGMGVVYKARQIYLNQTVALKILPHRYLDDPQAVSRFRREMQSIGGLDHPNIVRAYNAGSNTWRWPGGCVLSPAATVARLALALQPDHPQRRTIPHLWMRFAGQDVLHQPRRERTNLARPLDDACRRPLKILLMRLRPMRRIRRGHMRLAAAHMTGYTLALMEDLHRPARAASIDLLADQLIRRAVVMTAQFDVIIQIDTRLFPLRIHERMPRQLLQRWSIDTLIQLGPRTGQ